ncbi:MAG: DinB family protein [Gemmataceae bacterium]
MNGIAVIKAALDSTHAMLGMYLADFTDVEILERPVSGANHIAWQLGHLITSEIAMVRSQHPDTPYPDLPEGFRDNHSKEAATSDDPKQFHSVKEYVELYTKVHEATLAYIDGLTEEALDQPTKGNMAGFAPKLGNLLLLMSNHILMHAGQFTTVRRKLGKPVIF